MVTGSPPRAWGQCPRSDGDAATARFTPTGVGTIQKRRATSARKAVHPHGRGDNLRCRAERARRRGSPPRAWGQSARRRALPDRVRFTPTGVGTMYSPALPCPARAFHPHGRGDNASPTFQSARSGGSPPRAWGQFFPRPTFADNRRFTPTGVGTIARLSKMLGRFSVHPHGRGDNATSARRGAASCGSPPRAWGQSPQRPLLRSC